MLAKVLATTRKYRLLWTIRGLAFIQVQQGHQHSIGLRQNLHHANFPTVGSITAAKCVHSFDVGTSCTIATMSSVVGSAMLDSASPSTRDSFARRRTSLR